MKKFFTSTANPLHRDLGLLFLRLLIGVLMALIGYEKLIHFSDMAASDFWAKNVSFLGMTGTVPLALTVFAEFFCSVFIIFGFLTRFSCLVLLFCMGYIFTVVFPSLPITVGEHGFEFNTAFTYFVIYAVILFTGPGKYSIDYKFFTKI